MKQLLILSLLILPAALIGQKLEVSVQANSGAYHYAGKSATGTSPMNIGQTPNGNYTANPYGNKNGFSYGADVEAQLVTKNGFIAGLQGGYEILRSKVDINMVSPGYAYLDVNTPYRVNDYAIPSATGHTNLTNQMVNFNPYLGYRLKFKKVSLDLLSGIDLGINVGSTDKGKVVSEPQVYQIYYAPQYNINTSSPTTNNYTVNKKLPDAPTDVRLRFGLAALYKRFGLTANYAHGLTALGKNVSGYSGFEAHSELMRLGVSYRIR